MKTVKFTMCMTQENALNIHNMNDFAKENGVSLDDIFVLCFRYLVHERDIGVLPDNWIDIAKGTVYLPHPHRS